MERIASDTLLSLFLGLCEIAVQEGCGFGSGGEAGRIDAAVLAVHQACADGPADGINGIGRDACRVGEAGEAAACCRLHALKGRIAVEDGGKLLPGDAALVRHEQRVDVLGQRRLAPAVRAGDNREAAVGDGERQIVDDALRFLRSVRKRHLEGEVLEFKNNNVFVKSGLLKTRVKLSDIMILDKPKKKPVKTQHNVYRTSSRADADVKTEIDMRGETVDEALSELGLFIDRCVLNNIEEIRIIHGKGTGALRSAVTDYLKTHPNVSEYRLGRYGEGENGVTIAKLK